MKEVVLDTETTGISTKDGHRIVEIGCIELDNLIPTLNKFHSYLNPEKKVSEKAFKVHGYSDNFLSDKPKFHEIVDDFLDFIKDRTFLVAQGFNMGKSLYEKDCINIAKSILKISETNKCQIILPLDLVVSEKFETNAKFEIVSSNAVPLKMMALDIGPKTINKISSVFQKVNTLLWNGPVGAFETPPFGEGTFRLAREAAKLTVNRNLITVAGGGDTTSALNNADAVNDFTYVSSAGGAFLEWLEGIELPGISVLRNN